MWTQPTPLLARLSLMGAALSVVFTAACSDDPGPGSIVARWTHGPTPTCGTRGVTSIEARAIRNGEEVASATGDCPTDARRGSVEIPELRIGTYDVEIEAFNAEGRGTYLARGTRIAVREGEATETPELRMEEKPARLTVDWILPGGRCATAGVDKVEVSLTYNAGTSANVEREVEVPCDNVFDSPADPGTNVPGVLIADLPPNPDVIIFIYGKNAAGARISQGQEGPRAINPGDDDSVIISLEACPGSPPNCN